MKPASVFLILITLLIGVSYIQHQNMNKPVPIKELKLDQAIADLKLQTLRLNCLTLTIMNTEYLKNGLDLVQVAEVKYQVPRKEVTKEQVEVILTELQEQCVKMFESYAK